MVKEDKNKKKVSLGTERDIVLTESSQQGSQGIFPSEVVSSLSLGIDLGQDKEVSAMGFSLIERPARSSEEGKVLWERKVVKDRQNGIEIRES